MASPRSLLLITVDCLRADHVGFLGYQRPTTPFLDSLAAESLIFRNAIAAGAPTYYSFPAIMASRHALALGRDVVGLAPGEPTIATTLRESGYATAAFVAGNPYLSSRFGYSEGFDVFRDFLGSDIGSVSENGNPGDTENKGWRSSFNRHLSTFCHRFPPLASTYDELYFQYCQRQAGARVLTLDALRRFPAAHAIAEQASGWLSGVAGKPFFLWLHFMDPHAPYYPPEKAMELLGQDCPDAARVQYLNAFWNRGGLSGDRLRPHQDEVVMLYDAGIRWVDEQVARLTGTLRQLGVWNDCVVALTADHGEEFLDHGGRYHSPPKVNEEIIHVPLLLRAPCSARFEPTRQPFSLLDLAPTLLDAVEAQVPGAFRGRSHWKQLQAGRGWDDPAIVECIGDCRNPFRLADRLGPRLLAIREARYKLVLDWGAATESLFDLEADPFGLKPLSQGAEISVRRRLLERARRHLAESLRSRDDDARMAARLRDLRVAWVNSPSTAAVS